MVNCFFFQLKTDNKLFESVNFGWSHSHQKLTVWTNSCTIELLMSYLSEFGAEADTTRKKKVTGQNDWIDKTSEAYCISIHESTKTM
jgi:hypothetical protein